MEPNGRGKDDYPVYNHQDRPGIGKDHLGNFQYNCFWISLEEHSGEYLPFTFNDFIRQFNQYYKDTCKNCVDNSKIYTFDDVDRAAFSLKFIQRDKERGWADPYLNDEERNQDIQALRSSCYYCPLVASILSNSKLDPISEGQPESKNVPKHIEPIDAILGIAEDGCYSSSFDDPYYFKLLSVQKPGKFSSCPICARIASPEFIPPNSEKLFLKLYMLSVFDCLDKVAKSQEGLFLEDKDFLFDANKFFDFIFPIPQAWVYVIPKPPPGSNWREWENKHKSQSLPQRVDFMLTYEGERHIIELDGDSHYLNKKAYRETLADTRWLRRCGYQVHRFANEEISDLYSSSDPNLSGFKDLLYSEGLDLEKMILVENLRIKHV